MVVDINPEIFSIGPIHVRWYGLMYVIGFVMGGILQRKMVAEGTFRVTKDKVESLLTYMIIGMFIGARVFYVFVYKWDDFSNNFWEIFAVWKGGLSFHGAIVGFAVAGYLFAKRNKVHPFHIYDVCVTTGSQGLFLGRVGNFINGELFGRPSDVPWAMIFPAGGPYPRHPSQLYEAFFEGIVLFLILWFLRKRVKHCGILTGVFLVGYGTFRYFIEFFREADVQLGYYFGDTTTMGQILCFIMILAGFGLLYYSLKKKIPIAKG